MRLFLILIFLMIVRHLPAQDYNWWNEKHNWDGHTPWQHYLTISPSHMGPNALPVPEITNGSVDSVAELEVAGEYYFSRGDKTTSTYLRGYLPLFENRFAASIEVVPLEWYETDTITRDDRAARGKSGEGSAGGDIYLLTSFQLVRNHRSIPDLALRFGFRTASGTQLGDARFTDGAGYFFDMSAGKNFTLDKVILRPFVMLGFYAYQTFDVDHLQNDCISYGGGVDLSYKSIDLLQSFGGYEGYLNIGDKPLVYRAAIRLKNKIVDYKISYLWGVRDYDFQRFRFSIIVHPI